MDVEITEIFTSSKKENKFFAAVAATSAATKMTKQSICFKEVSDFDLDVVAYCGTKKKGNGNEKQENV